MESHEESVEESKTERIYSEKSKDVPMYA